MPQWTPDEAREHAAKGGRVAAARRRATKAKDPLAEIRRSAESRLEDYLKELQAAAKGEGAYSDLDIKERLSVNKFLFEWVAGRPTSRGPAALVAEDDDEGQEGFRLTTGGE